MNKILLIEDSREDVWFFQRAIRKAGLEVDLRLAEDGNQAIEILRAADEPTISSTPAWRPDLVLLDLNLPVVTGLEVLEWIRKRAYSPPLSVVVLTSSEAPGDIQSALRAGAHSFVVKPLNPSELLSRVRPFLQVAPAIGHLDSLAEGSDEVLCALAHNLKSMIGGILMNAELLHSRVAGLSDRRIGELASNILHSSNRTMQFVRQFLANSAADHGFVLKPEKVSLANAVAQVVQEYQEIARRKDLALHLVLGGSEAMIFVDPTALAQVLENLLSNAIKFSPPSKEILVSVHGVGDAIEFSVRDQGPGFNEADKAHLFERFARLTARPTAGEPSTGLGLSIVKKLTVAMGAQIHFHSNPGEGTIFTVRFQRASCGFS